MKKNFILSMPSKASDGAPVGESLLTKISKLSLKPLLALSLAAAGNATFAATCEYQVTDEWNTGFRADVVITNDSSEVLNDWQVAWEWSDGSTFNNGWSATYSCAGSECNVQGPGWSTDIAANSSFSFGFVGNKGTAGTPAEVPTLTGEICSSITPPTEPLVLWTLDGSKSSIQYVSVKNNHTAEVNYFSQANATEGTLEGSIDSLGDALLAIDLNDVETGIAIRNTRMVNFVFETEFLPTAYIHVELDTDALGDLAVGSTTVQTVNARLSLHGVSQDITTDLLIVKPSASEMTVSTLQPIRIDSKAFDFASGLEVLRGIANLSVIGEVAPVYFRLHYDANTDEDLLPIIMAAEPNAPDTLSASYDELSASATLNWLDNSNNESSYIVRRKPSSGLWQTVANLASNVSNFIEGLPELGEFDYKVIAINDSVPSAPSNTATVTVTEIDKIALGKQIYDADCASCHGPVGGGIGTFPAINTPRDLDVMATYIAENMPIGNPGACDQECAENVAAYIETLWVEEISCDRSIAPVSYGARQLKILTRSEYQRSVEDLLGVDFNAADGLSEDDKVGFFANNTHASIVASSYSNYLLVAEEIATWFVDNNFAPALSCGSANQDCADSFIDDLAPKIFRRPLSQDEIEAYSEMANGSLTNGDVSAGLKMALEGMLSSPQFLYRHELGETNPDNSLLDGDAFELTSYEMATFLAYTFTGSTPDDILLLAAANDALRDDDEILNQATRLVESTGSKLVMGDFVASWLGTEDLDIAAKDELVWPGFDALVPDMKTEIRENFANVMLDENESYASLYTPGYSYLNETLADHYGVPGVTGDAFRKVNTTRRGGILASGAFMARWGEAVETAPIIRSVRVRRRMLCQDQPAPPAGTFAAREAKLAELSELLQDPSTTNRVKYHRLTEDEPCTNCHIEYINPLGFGMEDFDTVGNFRTSDLNGNVIDAAGELFAPNDYNDVSEVEPFSGTAGLAQLLSTLPSAQACVPQQMFRFVTGVGHDEIDPANPDGAVMSAEEQTGYACEIENLTQSMMTSSPRSMLERFSLLEAVRYRKAWSRD